MPTSADPLLLDTSAAIALVSPNHAKHTVVRQVCRGRQLGLSGHAEFEMFSVLTRLPPPQRLTPSAALRLITTNFPETRRLPLARTGAALGEFADSGIAGGATYDALVGLAARHHDLTLLSTDARAAATMRSLCVELILV
jgi:predicted nucleic acid-binding protein